MPYILLNIFQSRPLLSINHPEMEFQANLNFADDEELDFASNYISHRLIILIKKLSYSFFNMISYIRSAFVTRTKKRLLEPSHKLGYWKCGYSINKEFDGNANKS